MSRINLRMVAVVPRDLQDGILYVSKEHAVAVHLCACGCKSKVVTPLGPAEWKFSEHAGLPSLSPSIGNWQLPCRTHYFIRDGKVIWARNWSEHDIEAGRRAEEARRAKYYKAIDKSPSFLARLRMLVTDLFKRH